MRALMLMLLMNLIRVAEYCWLVVVVPAVGIESRLKAASDWAETAWLLAVARGKTGRGG